MPPMFPANVASRGKSFQLCQMAQIQRILAESVALPSTHGPAETHFDRPIATKGATAAARTTETKNFGNDISRKQLPRICIARV
ncbi:MAG: hypothetical protein MJE12_16635 [Alphaproteobacteria bacterium]|nr:hypothetical protein [Alphaproteobacteria bacterium]